MFADDVRVCSRPTRVVLLQLKFVIIVHVRDEKCCSPDDHIVARDRRGKYPSAALLCCGVDLFCVGGSFLVLVPTSLFSSSSG